MPRYVEFFCYKPNPFIYWNYKDCVYLCMYIFMQTMKYGRMCSLCNWKFPPRPKTIFCFEELSWRSEGYYRFYVTVVTETASTNMSVSPENAINNTFIWHNDSVYHINTEPKPEYYQIKVKNMKIKAIPNRTIITKPSS